MERTVLASLVLVLFYCFIISACSNQADKPESETLPLLDTYFEAFNNHDFESLVRMCAEDIRLMSITPDTVTVDLEGREALQGWLEGYFSSLPNVESSYSQLSIHEPFYSFVETATWGPDSARKQQSSMATYQIEEGKIHRVWYYYPE